MKNREKIGDRPYEITKSGNKIKIDFFPSKPDAKHPNKSLFNFGGNSHDIENFIKNLKKNT